MRRLCGRLILVVRRLRGRWFPSSHQVEATEIDDEPILFI